MKALLKFSSKPSNVIYVGSYSMEVVSCTIHVLTSNKISKKIHWIGFHGMMKMPWQYYHGVFIFYENVISLDFHGHFIADQHMICPWHNFHWVPTYENLSFHRLWGTFQSVFMAINLVMNRLPYCRLLYCRC